jgi:ABC-type transport system involved in multi-copper enzyme maturation permease subunit
VKRIMAVAANTFRETVRERVLYNLVFFALLMMASGLLLSDLSIRQEGKIIKDVGLASIEIFGMLIALFLGVGLLTREIEKRSLYPLLARPLSRDELLLGKFTGLVFTIVVNSAVMTAGMFATQWVTGGAIDLVLLKAVYATVLSMLMVVALAQLLSVMTSPLIALVGTLGLIMAGRLSDVVKNVKQVIPDAPQWLIDTVYYLLPNFRHFDLKSAVVYGDPIPAARLFWLTAYACTYTGVALLAAILAFRRRELT